MQYNIRDFYLDAGRFAPIGWYKDRVENYWNDYVPEEKHKRVRLIGVQRFSRINTTTGFEFDETGLFNYGHDSIFKVILGLLEDDEMEYYNEYCAPEDRDLADWFCKVQGFYKSEWKWLEI